MARTQTWQFMKIYSKKKMFRVLGTLQSKEKLYQPPINKKRKRNKRNYSEKDKP